MAFLISFLPHRRVGRHRPFDPGARVPRHPARLGARACTIFRKIALPKTLPEFFGALKVAVTLAFIGTNLVEIVSPHGRGLGACSSRGTRTATTP
jgi:ABC-type nitrate/sulfonate/bicarbonate transport system permease component